MEVLDETTDKNGSHMTSAAAFVEGGIQDACDDACSICLEEFCESDPSTVTCCKHAFHLQCILEWCQRSSQCPMCWQPISLKDPTSQELLQAVERERNIRNAPVRIPAIFHHPTLGDFELQHLPVGANDPDLEERIIQHLAAAAAMGRVHHLSRRDIHRGRSSGHGRPHFLVLSPQPNGPDSSPVSASEEQESGGSDQNHTGVSHPSGPVTSNDGESARQIFFQAGEVPSLASGSRLTSASRHRIALSNRGSAAVYSSQVQDRAGPSDFQAFSESLKSKWNAVSMRYKESISKSTRGWRDRFFPRNNSTADNPDFENRREVSGRVDHVSHMMGNLEMRDNTAANVNSESSDNCSNFSAQDSSSQLGAENRVENPPVNGSSTSCPASSVSSSSW